MMIGVGEEPVDTIEPLPDPPEPAPERKNVVDVPATVDVVEPPATVEVVVVDRTVVEVAPSTVVVVDAAVVVVVVDVVEVGVVTAGTDQAKPNGSPALAATVSCTFQYLSNWAPAFFVQAKPRL